MSDENTAVEPAAAPDAAASRRHHKRKLFLRLLLIVVIVAIGAWALWYFLYARWYVSTDDAYVHGNVVQITPQVPGIVVSIGARNGDLVKPGQMLVRLDPSNAEVALQAAEASLAQAVREVRGRYNDVEAAKAEVAASQVALDKAKSDYERRKGLARSGAISAEVLAHAHDALAAARSALVTAQQKYHNSQALVSGTNVKTNPTVKAAEARLRAAYLDSVHTTLVAPIGGYVAKRTVQVGEHVEPGMALMAVVPLHQVWVEANFKETQLTDVRIGQPVVMDSDIYGGSVTYHGTVQAIGMGTGSAFSLLPAQNATGNWIKIVQRVPVRISLREDDLAQHPLRIGMSMTVKVNLHDQRGEMLAQKAPTKPVFTTDVYARQLAAANGIIQRIVEANMAHGGGQQASN